MSQQQSYGKACEIHQFMSPTRPSWIFIFLFLVQKLAQNTHKKIWIYRQR